MEDLLAVLPFGGTFDLVQLSGATLRKIFEFSVRRYGSGTGEFLQVSGTSSLLLLLLLHLHPPEGLQGEEDFELEKVSRVETDEGFTAAVKATTRSSWCSSSCLCFSSLRSLGGV